MTRATTAPPDGPGAEPSTAVHELRAAQDRDLRNVGVPMYLVLQDETGAPPVAAPAHPDPLATELDGLRATLAPTQRDDDLGVAVSLLTLAAHLDFGGPAADQL